MPCRPLASVCVPLCLALVTTTACRDGSTTPITAESVAVASGSGQTGTVGTALASPLAVKVTGSDGRGFAGAAVSWQVGSGGGTASPASTTTNIEGNATTTFTLGPRTGDQTVTASVAGVGSVTFSARARAGAVAGVEVVSGDGQTGAPGQPLENPIVVQIVDQFGNVVGDAAVTFTASGGGSANPGQATSGEDGRAESRWTLGESVGQQTLTIRASGLQAAATAEAFDPCQQGTAYSIGTSVSGELSTSDCTLQFNSKALFIDLWDFTLSSQTAVRLEETASDAFDPLLFLTAQTGIVALNDDSGGDRNSRIRAILPAGSYRILTTSAEQGTVGSYTLGSETISEAMENCALWWAVPGITSSQNLASGDCTMATSDGSSFWYEDPLFFYVAGGQTITVTMRSSRFDAWIDVRDANGNIVAQDNDSADGTNATVTFTPSAAGIFVVVATSNTTRSVGAYTIEVQ